MNHISASRRGLAAALTLTAAATLVGVTVLSGPALAAPAGVTTAAGSAAAADPAGVAGGFLVREMAATGGHLENGGFFDYGLTIDAILALDAAGVGQSAATAATGQVTGSIGGYISGELWGDVGSHYAGATGKALVLAAAQGLDPRSVGGVDLVATLTSLEQPSGQFKDVSGYGDYSNTIGQSFGVIGLHRAGAGPDAAAVAFLADQQCADGGFSLKFGASPCASDPDATAYAVQALLAVKGTGDPAATKGLDFLAAQQRADGSVGGTGPTAGGNANSTGLAGQAFVAGGRTTQARRAAAYISTLQYGCTFPAALRGGVAYDAAALTAHKSSPAVTDQDRRGTAQAALALAGTPLYAVTSQGAVGGTPTLPCASPTTSPKPSTSTRTSTVTATVTSTPRTGSGGGSGVVYVPQPVSTTSTTTTVSPTTTASATTDPTTTEPTQESSTEATSSASTTDLAAGPVSNTSAIAPWAWWAFAAGVALFVAGAFAVARRRGQH